MTNSGTQTARRAGFWLSLLLGFLALYVMVGVEDIFHLGFF
jgi:hypothetical protein